MVESQPSSDLDALLGFGEPANGSAVAASTPPQYQSRRELREAEARAARPAPAPAPTAKAVSTAVVAASPRTPRASAPRGRAIAKTAPRASQRRRSRKNPLSVLATMAVVGGMFAVAGLPAYALQTSEFSTAAAKTDIASQSVVVSAEATSDAVVRDDYRATTPEQLAQMNKDAARAQNQAAYLASGARELGDDYPWFYELREYQGGGLSPLNYYYRECVDFVAWRLNRDAGSYAAPFKWVWSNLTPSGGNASQWMYNWQQKGWPVSKTPVVGSVAYTGGNHVAYVKSINGDGTVTIEEYNYHPGVYGQRTIAISSVVAFLYPPT